MTTVYLSIPYEKEDAHGDVKKDLDETFKTKIAYGFILNETQLEHLKNSGAIKVVMHDRIKKRRAEGIVLNWKPNGQITKFGKRHDFKLSELSEAAFSPVVFKYHKTGVKIISSSGKDVK